MVFVSENRVLLHAYLTHTLPKRNMEPECTSNIYPLERKNTFQKFSGVYKNILYILKVGSEAATFSQTNVYKFEFELSSPLGFSDALWHLPILIGLMVHFVGFEPKVVKPH